MSSSRTIPSLDGLRAISIGLVLLGHVDHTRNAPAMPPVVAAYAALGVRVFFVISGFLITHLLLQEHARTGTISLRNFYLRRAFRILPAAYFFIVVITLAARSQFTRTDLFFTYAYLKSYYMKGPWLTLHLWSLSVEEQFYLLWPFAMAYAFRRRVAIASSVVLAGPFLRAAYYAMHWPSPEYSFPTVADALAIGCLLALAQPYLNRYAERIYRRWFLLVPVLALAIPLIPQLIPPSRAATWVWRTYATVGLSLMCLCIALSIDNAVRRRYRLLNMRPMIWLGVLSYSLYLWQMPFLDREVTRWWTAFPQNLACAFACAVFSYYAIERPCLRLRERLSCRTAVRRELELPVEAVV